MKWSVKFGAMTQMHVIGLVIDASMSKKLWNSARVLLVIRPVDSTLEPAEGLASTMRTRSEFGRWCAKLKPEKLAPTMTTSYWDGIGYFTIAGKGRSIKAEELA